jgi:hypothetical protein
MRLWPLVCAIAGVASSATAAPVAVDIVSAFRTVCATGVTGQKDELIRADALGWRTSGSGAPEGFDPRVQRLSPMSGPSLILSTSEETSHGETRDSCAVSSLTPVSGLTEATKRWLGFAPFFEMMNSATFAALRSGDAWQASPKLDRATLTAVKRDGRLYSFAVLDNGVAPKDGGYAASLQLMRAKTAP